MGVLRNAIKKSLAALGYEIRRSPRSSAAPFVRFENFINLAAAYEQHLNDADDLISPDEKRPQLLARLSGTPPSEAYFLVQALSRTRSVPCDVCEFGVAQGETSALIANEISLSGTKRLHLFDSFEGLPKPSDRDQLKDDLFSLGSIEAYEGTMCFPDDWVRVRLEAISFPADRYVIHRGLIDEVLREDRGLPGKVSFAYVDFDFYEPIRAALTFLHAVTPKGAIVIVDDYNFFSTGAKNAVDEFVSADRSKGPWWNLQLPNTRYGQFAVLTRVR